jgi:hypothetical protein
MGQLGRFAILIVLGALVLSPVVAYAVGYLGLDPVPGDIPLSYGNIHFVLPVAYSLGASVVLALFYWVAKR